MPVQPTAWSLRRSCVSGRCGISKKKVDILPLFEFEAHRQFTSLQLESRHLVKRYSESAQERVLGLYRHLNNMMAVTAFMFTCFGIQLHETTSNLYFYCKTKNTLQL